MFRAGQIRRAVQAGILQNITVSLPPTAADVTSWLKSDAAQADLLARVIDADRRLGKEDDARRHAEVLRSLDRDNGFVASWVIDADGRSLLSFGDTLSPPPGSATAGVTMGGGRFGPTIDLVALSGSTRVVLRVSPLARTFSNLNPARPGNLSGRTTLFFRRGDSLLVATSRSNGDAKFPDGFQLPAGVPSIDAAATGRPRSGVATGRSGKTVVFAAVPLPFQGWSLLREQQIDEVLRPLWANFAIELALVSGVLLMLAALANYWLRSSGLRREHELTRVRADFVASASHELRTPLAQIRMYAQLLRKGAMRNPGDTEKAVDVIEKESHRLSILVDNVLNFTRLRRQVARVATVPALVGEEIRHVIEAFAPLAKERSVRIDTHVELGLRADVDSFALRQILLNFLENAVKYGPVGQAVLVSATGKGGWVSVGVEDHGPGIPENEREVVWQPFVRGAAATAGNTTGSGIGLAVVRDLVLQHGGRYSIESAPGQGSRFVVEFPASP